MVRFVWHSFLQSLQRALHSPFAFQVVILGFFVMFVLGFRPPYFFWSQEIFGEEFFGERSVSFPISEVGFLDNFAGVRTAGLREVLVEDESGNLFVRIQPRKRDATINYTVKSGDNPSKIAHKFGIKVSTLLWANDLNAKQSVQVGQSLRIPPTDGVYYQVQRQDTLSEIAKTHDIELSKIYAYNRISAESVLQAGQEVFLPDAQKIFIATRPTVPAESSVDSSVIESIGIRIRRPTQGVLTQGFHNGHYAIDIANKLNTPIYAAASGKVIKADLGWNYGYGNHIIVDHGNEIETLYGHMNVLKVEEGDEIKTGQLLGLMGNSGRVWGPTGIHLHFELRIRGRKVNPNNYF
ncbi:peptidoglycan DD-metalloendopeptidase family protein [Candidatus Gracilibacteria bacterium]|nr:peptidoglycan DD-metalloendopeptidase family protein [Candidatus Gracilibacteria bacterium]